MQFTIDRYAYRGRVRMVDPAIKFVLAITVLVLVLALNTVWVSALALLWMCAITIFVVGVPWRVYGGLLAGEALFVILATIGVILTFSLAAPGSGMAWSVHLGPLWLSSNPESLMTGLALVARAVAGGAAMAFLALSTPFIDIAVLMRRMHIPALLIDMMMLCNRFIFVFVERLSQMQVAQEGRLGRASRRAMLRSAALLASALFMDVFRHTERLQIALDSRGFDGEFRVLSMDYQRDWRWLLLTCAVGVSLVWAWLL